MLSFKICVAGSVWLARPARGSLYQRTEGKMEAELLTKLTALSEKEIAYLNGVVDGLNAAASATVN